MEEKGNGTMALRTVPDIEVFLDKPRNIRFDYRAEILAERSFSRFWNEGVDPDERQAFSIWEIRQLAAKASRAAICALLHGALLHEDKNLTYEATLKLYQDGDQNAVAESLRKAIEAHYPTAKTEEKKTGPEPKSDQAAQSSGPSPESGSE